MHNNRAARGYKAALKAPIMHLEWPVLKDITQSTGNLFLLEQIKGLQAIQQMIMMIKADFAFMSDSTQCYYASDDTVIPRMFTL